MLRLLTVFSVLVAGLAFANAKPRIAVMNFEGPKASKLQVQLKKKLCSTFTCVKPGKSKDVAVDAVVTGAVHDKTTLALKIYTDESSDPVSTDLDVPRSGKLGKKAFTDATAAVKSALKAAASNSSDDSDDSDGVGQSGAAP